MNETAPGLTEMGSLTVQAQHTVVLELFHIFPKLFVYFENVGHCIKYLVLAISCHS